VLRCAHIEGRCTIRCYRQEKALGDTIGMRVQARWGGSGWMRNDRHECDFTREY